MKLTSSAFIDGDPMPTQYTCDGEGVPPPLTVSGVPPEAASLSLTVTDPDAPRGTFTHWVKRDIAPGSEDLSGGTEGGNSAGRRGWYPPCPPSGTHRYVFKVSALDGDGKAIASAQLIGTYGR
ncbi:MAG TPA: YbhB/YbcL family Raf kinase inhibitor-like protein [Candidatus Paceibacterota bacterium]|nr:YbhB/YbcL family Raf kinase inhibitor-like protein [Candidatus Paceibacterota bacterium]